MWVIFMWFYTEIITTRKNAECNILNMKQSVSQYITKYFNSNIQLFLKIGKNVK